MAYSESSQQQPDPTAAGQAAVDVPPEIVAGSLREYLQGWAARVRGGQSGVLPVVAGMLLIIVIFEVISPNHIFLSAGHVGKLFPQSARFMVLAIAREVAPLLGGVDPSVG